MFDVLLDVQEMYLDVLMCGPTHQGRCSWHVSKYRGVFSSSTESTHVSRIARQSDTLAARAIGVLFPLCMVSIGVNLPIP